MALSKYELTPNSSRLIVLAYKVTAKLRRKIARFLEASLVKKKLQVVTKLLNADFAESTNLA